MLKKKSNEVNTFSKKKKKKKKKAFVFSNYDDVQPCNPKLSGYALKVLESWKIKSEAISEYFAWQLLLLLIKNVRGSQ